MNTEINPISNTLDNTPLRSGYWYYQNGETTSAQIPPDTIATISNAVIPPNFRVTDIAIQTTVAGTGGIIRLACYSEQPSNLVLEVNAGNADQTIVGVQILPCLVSEKPFARKLYFLACAQGAPVTGATVRHSQNNLVPPFGSSSALFAITGTAGGGFVIVPGAVPSSIPIASIAEITSVIKVAFSGVQL